MSTHKFVLLDNLPEVPSGAVLVDNPVVVPGLVPVMKIEDVRVLDIVYNFDLSFDIKIKKYLVKHTMLSLLVKALESDEL